MRVCEYCETPIDHLRSDARFCKASHRVEWHRQERERRIQREALRLLRLQSAMIRQGATMDDLDALLYEAERVFGEVTP